MLILGLDTASDAVGAAVLEVGTDRVLGRAVHLGPAAHGEQLAPLVAAALAQAGCEPADLGAIGVGRGPGPYTGLRVGLVHAEVLGWVLGIPVHGVVTPDAIAAQAVAAGLAGPFLVVTDARRREVHWASYADGGQRVDGPHVGPPTDVPHRDTPALGAGAARYPDAFPDHREPLHPDPAWVARLAAAQLRAGASPEVAPLYLRRPDAVAATTRKRVTPA
ncbi:MAG: tRNA (adenosine(37)-N6)-threonylcarbamoyltransferase complex dimerization subunit type 1 TsaB [Candidatus Nanopelagicales bacterium]|nr:tRNA (adenosine(37)-N6)-threonylcarbamoyltransferase complex dimerization subunit type 1 TsaB [Candidatus Nanopelagicales bacterium]